MNSYRLLRSCNRLLLPHHVQHKVNVLNNIHRCLATDNATVREPLNRLLCKEATWHWSNEEQKAFYRATEMCSSTVLIHFDPKKELILMCDTSAYCISAVLAHVNDDGTESPIVYAFQTLSIAERVHCMLVKEGLASGVEIVKELYLSQMAGVQYEYILTETKGEKQNVGVISLNRPRALNSLSDGLMNDVCHAIQAYEKDPSIGCLVITGKGKAFAAGADIKEMEKLEFADVFMGGFLSHWACVSTCQKPIIAAVNGYALGGGCELAMMCDIIYASTRAKFGQPEIKLGTIPGAGGTQRLCKAIGKSRAMELILSGNMITAEEAERKGLVSRVVGEDELMDETLKLAEQIGGLSKIIVAMAKEAVNAAYEMNLEEGLQYEKRLFHSTFATADRREGMTAFNEKRDPNFQDK